MTDYLIILLAVAFFATQFAFTKVYECTVRQTINTTLVMLIVTSVIGTILYLIVGGFRVSFSPISLLWASLFAIVMIPYYTVGIKVLSMGSLAIYSMFMMLGGMLVPFFYGILFLHEELLVGKIFGTLLLTLFIVLQALWQPKPDKENGHGAKEKYLFFTLCILIFFLNGLTGVIAKAHQISEGAVDEVSFTVISCALTAIFSALLFFIYYLKKQRSRERRSSPPLSLCQCL